MVLMQCNAVPCMLSSVMMPRNLAWNGCTALFDLCSAFFFSKDAVLLMMHDDL